MRTINEKACVANGRNLIVQSDLKNGYLNRDNGSAVSVADNFYSDNYIATNGATVFTFSSPDYVFKGNWSDTLAMYDSDKKFLGYQIINSPTQTLSQSNTAYIRFSINFVHEGGTIFKLSDWLVNHRYKLETGTLATPWTPAPVDKVFSNGRQVYGRNLLVGTDSTIRQAPGSFQWIANISKKVIKVGESLYFSAFINNAPHAGELLKGSAFCVMQAKDVSGKMLIQSNGNAINFDADGISQVIMVVPNETDTIQLFIVNNNTSMLQNPYYGYPKLEAGDVATPWTLAPEDVLK